MNKNKMKRPKSGKNDVNVDPKAKKLGQNEGKTKFGSYKAAVYEKK